MAELEIVYSTRKINKAFIAHIEETIGLENVKINPVENEGLFSLCSVYNSFLNTNKPTSPVVFCHDDIKFRTPGWGKILKKTFEKNEDIGILGVAGTDHLFQPAWWTDEQNQMKKPFTHNYGAVNHIKTEWGKSEEFETRYGEDTPKPKRVVVCDGLFLAVHPKRIVKMFDPNFGGFHFYDIDFCLSNYLQKVGVFVTTEIRLAHNSGGNLDFQWKANANMFLNKYNGKFPFIVGKAIGGGQVAK